MPVSASSEEWADRWHIAWDRAWDRYNIQEPDRMKHPTQELMRFAAGAGTSSAHTAPLDH